MKKVLLSASSLILATAFSFAGTPETKTEAKAKPEVKTNTELVYHYVSQNTNGTINFAEGPATNCPQPGTKPCEWTSDNPMTSPLSPSDIESQATAVTETRN
jgi:hypothetical protein